VHAQHPRSLDVDEQVTPVDLAECDECGVWGPDLVGEALEEFDGEPRFGDPESVVGLRRESKDRSLERFVQQQLDRVRIATDSEQTRGSHRRVAECAGGESAECGVEELAPILAGGSGPTKSSLQGREFRRWVVQWIARLATSALCSAKAIEQYHDASRA
jgi:hypothetical protein